MELKNTIEIGEQFSEEVIRTSENNMLCTVPYESMTQEEQEEVEQILEVAN